MENTLNRIKRIGLMALLVGVVGMSLSACGGDAATATPPPAPTATTAPAATDNTGSDSATAQEVKISLTEWAITPSNVEVNAGRVKFIVTNEGQFTHNVDFLIEGAGEAGKTKDFKSSENPQTLELDLKPGTYNMICSITGHADRGMKGTLVVK